MFGGLFVNEVIKLFTKKKTYIIWGLFIILCAILVVVNETAEKNYLRYSSPEAQIENLTAELKNQESYLASLKTDTSLSEEEKQLYEVQGNSYLESLKEQIAAAKASLTAAEGADWRDNLKEQIEEQKKTLNETEDSASKKYQAREIEKLQMHLDNNIPLDDSNYNTGINYYVLSITMIAASFLGFGLIMFNGDNVSSEYNPGTLKFLLIQPVSRIKVLLSKFLVMVFSSALLIMITQFLFFIGVGLVKGFGGFNRPVLVGLKYEYIFSNGQKYLTEITDSGYYIPLWQYLLKALLLQFLFLIVMVTFILLISTISKSSVIAMTVLICTILGANIVYSLSATYRKVSPFIFLHYSNIDDIITGRAVLRTSSFLFTGQTVIIMSILSVILFLGASLWVFKKRDIQI